MVNQNTNIRIVCYSDSKELGKVLSQEYDVETHCFSQVPEMLGVMRDTPFHGMVLDMPRLVRTSAHERVVLQEVQNNFECMNVNFDPRALKVRALGDLDVFFNISCRQSEPRTIRRKNRLRIHAPLLISRFNDPEMKSHQRTHTLNMSEAGVFIYTSDIWTEDEWVWIRFLDLIDPTPILCYIRWKRPWGTGLKLSGLGTAFAIIKKGQHNGFCNHFLLVPPSAPLGSLAVSAKLEELRKNPELSKFLPQKEQATT